MSIVDAEQLTVSGPSDLGPVYTVIRRESDGYAWNGTAFEEYDAANWATYVIPFNDFGGGQYGLIYQHTELPQGGAYLFVIFEQQGEDPATTDLKLQTQTIAEWGVVEVDAGDILVTHDTGGTDHLRYVDSEGDGVECTVTAYLTSEYAADALPRGQSSTNSEGRWIKPMKLFAGDYTFAFDAAGYVLGTVEQEVA